MRMGKIFGVLALLALCATSAMALSGSGGGSSVAVGTIIQQNLGTLANNASLSINWANGSAVVFQCQGTNTINAPTNPVTNTLYSITEIYNSTNACNPTNLTWPATFLDNVGAAFSTAADGPVTNTGPAATWTFVWDGTNYRYSQPSNIQANNSWLRSMQIGGSTINGGASTFTNNGTLTLGVSSGANLSLKSGSVLSSTGGAIPTVTCSGGSTGTSVTAGSTNNRGSIVSSSSASTNCTITWSAAAAWPQAPFCYFFDAGASITPTTYSTGACGTSTCVVDFASTTSKTIGYLCM